MNFARSCLWKVSSVQPSCLQMVKPIHRALRRRWPEGPVKAGQKSTFYDKSINYAALIQEIKREKGKTDADRFHVGFFMQNTPEVIYLLGGCAFTNSTLVGLNNAQIGEKLAVDINNMEIDVLFVDEVQQPKTGKTFLENVIVAQKKYGFSTLDQKYIIARKKQKNDHPGSISTIGERLEQHTGSDFTPAGHPR